MTQQEQLHEPIRRINACALETGTEQVIDVFDGKIVVRKPI